MGKDDFQFLNLLLTKLQNTLVPNSLDKLMELILMEPHIYNLDRDKITDLDKFAKKLHSVVLSWCNLKVVSSTFLPACFVCLKETTCGTRKKVFYFTLKALFILR